MTKKKHLLPTINDGYKQTDISTYFKVTNKISSPATMKNEQCIINKENKSEEHLVSPRKKPKPISSDDETEIADDNDILNSQVEPSNTSKCELSSASSKTPKPVLREYQPPQNFSLKKVTMLPLELPSYSYSEDSDSEVCSDDKTASQPQHTRSIRRTKEWIKRNSEPITSISNSVKNVAIKVDIKNNLEIKPVVISSDEDFEATPRKIRKVDESVLNDKKRTAKETAKKDEEFSASKTCSKSRRKLYQSDTINSINNEEKKNSKAASSGISSEPSTSKTISIHTIVSTTAVKSKPQILQEKSNSNANVPSTSAEFISTDLSSRSDVDLLSKSILSKQNRSFTTENVTSMPKTITVLENIVINRPAKILQQCNLNPIEKNVRKGGTIKQNLNSAQLKNVEDMTRRNSITVAAEESEDSSLTIRFFSQIVSYIGAHSHLKTMLTCAESDMLTQFFSMPRTEYRILCFKLFTGIQKWYNIFKLKDDLSINLSGPEMKKMYDCIHQNKFVEIDFLTVRCSELLSSLSFNEVKGICETLKIKLTNAKRYEMVEKLLINCTCHITVTRSTELLKGEIKKKLGKCVKLSPDLYNLFNKVYLLYSFTTSEFLKPSDLHDYLKEIMNKEIFLPKFNVNTNIKIFSSIAQFSKFAEACEHKRVMQENPKKIVRMLELSKLAHAELQEILKCNEEQKPSYLMRFTAGYKYTKTLSLGAQHLAGHYPDKVQKWLIFLIDQDRYCLKLRGYWIDLLVKVQYYFLKQYETAANTLRKAFGRKDLSRVDLQELSHRAEAMKRSKAHPISKLLHDEICMVQPPPLRDFPCRDVNVIHDEETRRKGKCSKKDKTEEKELRMTVEDKVEEEYCNKGYVNNCSAGNLLETIFFILFWDIIYESAVQDAFILEIQHFPLDLMSQEFYTNRKEEIDKRLEEIQCKWPYDQLKRFISNIWKKHAHEKSFISEVVNKPEKLYIIFIIGRVKLASMLERIAKDFETYHSELPDLFLWSVQANKYKFVKIKSQKDKLSAKQELWLEFLLSVGADVEVCNVHTAASCRKPGKIKKEVKKQEKRSPNKCIFLLK